MMMRKIKKTVASSANAAVVSNSSVMNSLNRWVCWSLDKYSSAQLFLVIARTMMVKNGARDRGSRFLSLFTVVR